MRHVAPVQGGMLAQLDAAARVAAEVAGVQWPSRRVCQLGDLRLNLACESALGKNATKPLGALDEEARKAAATLISGCAAGSGLLELAAEVTDVTLLPLLQSICAGCDELLW